MSGALALILTYKYYIILPLAVIQGPFVALILGYLIHEGHMNLFVSFAIMLAADIVLDFFYYFLGRYGHGGVAKYKFFAQSKWVQRNLSVLENMWHNHAKKTMFFGKLAYGIAPAIIVTSGIAKLPIRRFLFISVPVGMLQIGAFMFVGYYLGASYEVAQDYVEYPGIIITSLLAVTVLIYILFAKYTTKLLKREAKNEVEYSTTSLREVGGAGDTEKDLVK